MMLMMMMMMMALMVIIIIICRGEFVSGQLFWAQLAWKHTIDVVMTQIQSTITLTIIILHSTLVYHTLMMMTMTMVMTMMMTMVMVMVMVMVMMTTMANG